MKLKRRELMAEVDLLLSSVPITHGFPCPCIRVFHLTSPFSKFKAEVHRESDDWHILVGRRLAEVYMAWNDVPVLEKDALHLAFVDRQPIAIAIAPPAHSMVGYAGSYALIGILADFSFDTDKTVAVTMHAQEMLEVR